MSHSTSSTVPWNVDWSSNVPALYKEYNTEHQIACSYSAKFNLMRGKFQSVPLDTYIKYVYRGTYLKYTS